MNKSPNIAFFGGTVIIAIMVMAAFANMSIAAGNCPRSNKSAEAPTEQFEPKHNKESGMDA